MVSTPQMAAAEIFYGFEAYYEEFPASRRVYPMVLKELYDADVVSEQGLLGHYTQDLPSPGFSEAKAAAKPFLAWLQEGSESGSGSDSDSSG